MTVLSTLPMANARLLEKRGRCSKGSRWTLSLERENSIIDVDFEAENRVLVQQDWDIIIRNNNAQDDEVDNDSIYIFDVSTDIVNRRGRDRVVARATASETGEVCVGTLVLR